jgi:hypothetical protein
MTRVIETVLQMGSQQPEKGRELESSFNNRRLDQQARTGEKHKTIYLASIFGGTSIY